MADLTALPKADVGQRLGPEGVALEKNGVTPVAVVSIQQSLAAFGLYGFPESHAISFALIAYASAWLKVHRAAAFYAGLLNNQPMGFYSCASLVQDARRHDVKTLPVCVKVSDWQCRVETDESIRLGFLSISGVREAAIKDILATRKKLRFSKTAAVSARTGTVVLGI